MPSVVDNKYVPHTVLAKVFFPCHVFGPGVLRFFLEPLFLLESPKNTIKIFYKLLILAHFIIPLFIINKFYVHEKYGFIQTFVCVDRLFYFTLCSKNIHIAFIIQNCLNVIYA